MNEQKHLKKGGLLAFVTILGMAPPLSTDMYMPSLPVMAKYFDASNIYVNLTLVVFFLFMAFGMLFFGPLSDRMGRKKPLLLALFLYFSGSVLCTLSFNIFMLIAARCIQAFGSGGMVSLSLAVIKDSFIGPTRDKALALVQSMSVIAPIASPVIGAFIVQYSTWRTVFVVLACISVLLILLALLFTESIHEGEKNNGTTIDSLKRMVNIGKNPSFMPFLISVSFFAAPFYAYLSMASYTYEVFFGLSASKFSMFFAINAGFSVLGPVLFITVSKRIKKRNIMWMLLFTGFIFSVMMFFLGETGPWIFLILFIPFGVSNSLMRPYSTSLLLDQQEGDAGSASALLNFTNTLFGSMGMLLGSLPWSSYISGLSSIMMICIGLSAITYIVVLKSNKINMKGL